MCVYDWVRCLMSVSANVFTDSYIFLLMLQYGSASGTFSDFGARKDPPSLWDLAFFQHREFFFLLPLPFGILSELCLALGRENYTMKMSCLWTKCMNSFQLNTLAYLFLLAGKRWRHRRRSCSTRWWQGLMFVVFSLKSKLKFWPSLFQFSLISGHHIVYFSKKYHKKIIWNLSTLIMLFWIFLPSSKKILCCHEY